PESTAETTRVLLVHFDKETEKACLPLLTKLRNEEIAAELYPESSKMKKQFDYANKKGIPYVLIVGSEEIKSGNYSLKNMLTGEQESMTINEIIDKLNV